jgi:hypothetical protein
MKMANLLPWVKKKLFFGTEISASRFFDTKPHSDITDKIGK